MRGCGLSSRRAPEVSAQARVQDPETVVDALGLSLRATVPVTVAARHRYRDRHISAQEARGRHWLHRQHPPMEIPTNLDLALWFHRARTPATILLKRGADAQRVFLGRRHPGKFVLIP
jgi:hypothetical protein